MNDRMSMNDRCDELMARGRHPSGLSDDQRNQLAELQHEAEEEEEPECLDYFAVVGCRFRGRDNVREPLDPFLHLELLSTTAPRAELRLTPASAVELMARINQELGRHFQRADIQDVLMRTKPGILT